MLLYQNNANFSSRESPDVTQMTIHPEFSLTSHSFSATVHSLTYTSCLPEVFNYATTDILNYQGIFVRSQISGNNICGYMDSRPENESVSMPSRAYTSFLQ